jgi:hypothetical protein
MNMLHVRETYEITGSIVMPNTIKMMNYPTSRKRFAVGFLPNNEMFSNPSALIRAWMFRLVYKNVSMHVARCPTLPCHVSRSFTEIRIAQTTVCRMLTDWFPANKTRVPVANLVVFAVLETFF